VDDDSIDAVISNCVINLSPEKHRVFAEAYRVLRPGGRLMVSDIVLERSLPDEWMESLDATLGCVGGASLRSRYLAGLADAGFADVKVVRETSFSCAFPNDDPRVRDAAERYGLDDDEMAGLLDAVTSVHVMARKPIRPPA
jgi:SAM-dependent methyltransferase